MWYSAKVTAAVVLIYLAKLSEAIIYPVSNAEWDSYKMNFEKVYSTSNSEIIARYNYGFNKNLINSHNRQFSMGLRTYHLRVNQFTDMKQMQMNSLFPLTKQPVESYETPLPMVSAPPLSFHTILGLNIRIQNQGTVCNSGWAYATAKVLELLNAYQMGQTNPEPLSAQNLIDCAGRGSACRNQVPQQAFDFLAVHGQGLQHEVTYANNPFESEPGMCLPAAGTDKLKLAKYSRIRDGDDETLMRMIGAGFPVVVEINPTFEFLHYAGGVYKAQSGLSLTRGSHFVTVIGYDRDVSTNLDYWLVVNSFGSTWGETGLVRILRSAASPLARSAILPIELG